jgi:hypothetical protein
MPRHRIDFQEAAADTYDREVCAELEQARIVEEFLARVRDALQSPQANPLTAMAEALQDVPLSDAQEVVSWASEPIAQPASFAWYLRWLYAIAHLHECERVRARLAETPEA